MKIIIVNIPACGEKCLQPRVSHGALCSLLLILPLKTRPPDGCVCPCPVLDLIERREM